MALNITSTQYGGKLATPIIKEAVSKSDFITKSGIQVRPSFKDLVVLPEVDFNPTLKSYTVDPDFSYNSASYNERQVELCKFRSDLKIDHDKLESTYYSEQYANGFVNEKITQTDVYRVITQLMLDQIKYQYSLVALNGDTSIGSGLESNCDGLIKKLEDDADTNDVSGNLTALQDSSPSSIDNVLTELESVVDAMPDKVKYDNTKDINGNLILAVSPKVAETLRRYYKQSNDFMFDPRSAFELAVEGYTVVPIVGMEDNEVLFYNPNNIFNFVDAREDFNDLIVTDQMKIQNIDSVYLTVKFKGAISYGRADEIVLYQAS